MAKIPNTSLSEVIEVPQHLKKRATGYLNVLNHHQKRFCILYATKEEFFANGVHSYAKAYSFDLKRPGAYDSAMASAGRLLSDVKILLAIDALMILGGLNNAHADKQLNFLMTQNRDFKTKLGSIKEFNALHGRIIQKLEHKGVVLMGDIIRAHQDENQSKDAGIPSEPASKQGVALPQVPPKNLTQGHTRSHLVDEVLKSHGI